MVARSLVNIFLVVLCFAVLINTGHGYISCYVCDKNCTNTNITHLPQPVCKISLTHMDHYSNAMERELEAKNTTNTTVFCVSYYYKDTHDPTKTGIYRGCYFATTSSVCQELSADLRKSYNLQGTITECHVCNTSNCNTHHVNGSTVAAAFSSLVLLFVSIIVLKC